MDCVKCHTPIPADGRYCTNCGASSDDRAHVCSSDPADELQRRLARTLEGRYEITRLLGRGGMAVVFLARDLVLERQVAIKVLPPDMSHDTQLVARFQQEAKTAAKLDHPNIIPIYRVESEAGLDYIVMKYVTGRSLEDLIQEGPLAADLVRRVLRDAALALGHAHQRHVVHRDVKPANIMLDADGRVILTDFGISKAVQAASQLTATGMVIGTPHYMAPEQAKGSELDGRADQYALAVVGHQALTAELPFDGSVPSILYKHVFEPPPPIRRTRPDAPADLCAALERALGKEPEQRFATMEAFAAAVSGEVAKTRVSRPVPPARRDKRGGLVAVVAVGVAAALAVGAGVVYRTDHAGKGPPAVLPDSAMAPAPSLASAAAIAIPESNLPVPSPAESISREPVSQVEPESKPTLPPAPRSTPRRGSPPARQPAAQQPALLTVASEPWGTLYLDDVEIGPTPVADFRIGPGTHRIRVEQEGYKTKTETIVVTGPNPIRRRYSLDPGGAP